MNTRFFDEVDSFREPPAVDVGNRHDLHILLTAKHLEQTTSSPADAHEANLYLSVRQRCRRLGGATHDLPNGQPS